MAQLRVDLRLLSQRVAAILSIFLLLVSVVVAQPESPVTRVLFVGNSYVYFNNLPEILTKLAEVGLQRRIETRMIAPGGWKLKDHWEKGEALKALHESKWDYVVLQDQSTLGVNYYLEGKPRVTTDEIFRPYAIRWAAEIRKAGGTPVFYLTWARRATPEDQAALNYAYMRSARDSASLVAPVGPAWSRLRQRQPAIELFAGDELTSITCGQLSCRGYPLCHAISEESPWPSSEDTGHSGESRDGKTRTRKTRYWWIPAGASAGDSSRRLGVISAAQEKWRLSEGLACSRSRAATASAGAELTG